MIPKIFKGTIIIFLSLLFTFFCANNSWKIYVDLPLIVIILLFIYLEIYCVILYSFVVDLYTKIFLPFFIPIYLVITLLLILFSQLFVLKNNLSKIIFMVFLYLPINIIYSYFSGILNTDVILAHFYITTVFLIFVSYILNFLSLIYRKLVIKRE
jgi:hypothetical protein